MTDEQLPTRDDQWRNYERAKATYDAAMDAWRSAGALGPRPPRPVPPHTPGWNPRLNPDLD